MTESEHAGRRAVWTALSQAMRTLVSVRTPELTEHWHETALRKILANEVMHVFDGGEIPDPLEWLIADRFAGTNKKPANASMMTMTDIARLTGAELSPTAIDLLTLTWQLGTIIPPARVWDHDPWPAIIAEARYCGLDPDAIHAEAAAAALAARKGREAPATEAAAAPADDKPAAPAKAAPAKKRATAAADFMRPMQPSSELAAIVGDAPIPRTEITARVWKHIKDHKLQDQTNRRMINTDDLLAKVCAGKSSVSMFDMTKLISAHLSPVKAAKAAKATA